MSEYSGVIVPQKHHIRMSKEIERMRRADPCPYTSDECRPCADGVTNITSCKDCQGE
jgi:hypothetical protein